MTRAADARDSGLRVVEALRRAPSDESDTLGSASDEWMTESSAASPEQVRRFWLEYEVLAQAIPISHAEARYALLRVDGMSRAQAIECALYDQQDVIDAIDEDPVYMRRELRRRAEVMERRPPMLRALRWLRSRGSELGVTDPSAFQWSADSADEALQLVMDEMQLRIESDRQSGRETPSAVAGSIIAAVRERNRYHRIGESEESVDRVIISGEDALR